MESELNGPESLDVLFEQMAALTLPKCKECRVPMSCCDTLYCLAARDYMLERGFPVPEATGHKTLPFMGEGGCIVPPHMRPLCTLHVCSINSVGADKDAKWTEEYFKLRERIEEALDEEAFYEHRA